MGSVAVAMADPCGVAAARGVAATDDEFVTPDGLVIERREVWAGTERPALGPIGDEDVQFLLVHHTATPNGLDPISVMRGAYDFHTGERGWPDVAYNFFIDRFGTVYEGREGSLDRPVRGDATGGNQGKSHLVCLLGDFTVQLPTPEALAALDETLAWLADRFGIDTTPGTTVAFVSEGSNRWPVGSEVVAATISGHRDMSRTACPGDAFYPVLVAEVPGRVDALRRSRAVRPTTSVPIIAAPTTTTTDPTGTAATTTAPLTTAPTAPVATGSTVAPASRSPDTVPMADDPASRSGAAIALGAAAAAGAAGAVAYGIARRSRGGDPTDAASDDAG